MIRTVFVPFIAALGGVERLILGLDRFLQSRGLEHEIVCFRQTMDLAAHADWPLSVRELRPARHALPEAWALRRHLTARASEGNPPALIFDLKGAFYSGIFSPGTYHLHLTDPPGLLAREVSKYAFSLRRVYPAAATAGILKSLHGELVHRINRRGARRASSVVVMTESIAEELQRIYALRPRLLRPGPSVCPRPRAPAPTDTCVRFLSVSRLTSTKRIDWIVRALGHLATQGPRIRGRDWTLDVVGEGPERHALEQLVAETGIADRVRFHGAISEPDLQAMYARAGLFIMPAAQGYGLPALEALARGIPVILHRDSGVSEVLADTPWAEIIDGGVANVAASITRMMSRIADGMLDHHPIPAIPTETAWAQELSELCHWL